MLPVVQSQFSLGGPKKSEAMPTIKLKPKSAVAAQLRVTILAEIEGLASKLAFWVAMASELSAITSPMSCKFVTLRERVPSGSLS